MILTAAVALVIAILALIIGSMALVMAWLFSKPIEPSIFEDDDQ